MTTTDPRQMYFRDLTDHLRVGMGARPTTAIIRDLVTLADRDHLGPQCLTRLVAALASLERARHLQADGMNLQQIADELGVSRLTAWRWTTTRKAG